MKWKLFLRLQTVALAGGLALFAARHEVCCLDHERLRTLGVLREDRGALDKEIER